MTTVSHFLLLSSQWTVIRDFRHLFYLANNELANFYRFRKDIRDIPIEEKKREFALVKLNLLYINNCSYLFILGKKCDECGASLHDHGRRDQEQGRPCSCQSGRIRRSLFLIRGVRSCQIRRSPFLIVNQADPQVSILDSRSGRIRRSLFLIVNQAGSAGLYS